jgi:hypothetical protein
VVDGAFTFGVLPRRFHGVGVGVRVASIFSTLLTPFLEQRDGALFLDIGVEMLVVTSKVVSMNQSACMQHLVVYYFCYTYYTYIHVQYFRT